MSCVIQGGVCENDRVVCRGVISVALTRRNVIQWGWWCL